MTDRDLKLLKDDPVPAPRDAARAAALRAAMNAFDQTEKKEEAVTQGSAASPRQTGITSITDRRRKMYLSRPHMAIAASLAVVAVSTPAAVYFYQQHGLPGLSRTANAPPFVLAEKPQPVPSKDERSRRAEGDKTAVAAAPEPKRQSESGAAKSGGSSVGGGIQGLTSAPPAPPASEVAKSKELRASERTPYMARDKVSDIAQAVPGRSAQPHEMGAPRPLTRSVLPVDPMPRQQAEQGRDKFETVASNPVKQVTADPVSTFSVDVDTASYAFVRRSLNAGRLPQKAAVRVEELINYFSYDYAKPERADEPFKPTVTVTPSPWNADTQLVHIGIKGYEIASADRPRANLVFLVDVSGSMQPEDRLPLLKNAFRMLVETLKPDDTVGIVTYASGSGVVLEPTKVAERGKILSAIDSLGAGGSTAGAQGIRDAYRLAETGFQRDAVNRVILGTDGDFNVGITDRNELKSYIERKRESGVFLSILGVGRGNYNDALMQTLAQNGNGTAAYIDTLNEARKVLVDEASSTLFPIAKDVKIQVEFNPAQVSEYRLIGYETRALRREDFNNDKVDAGDVGAGHAVTAIYEITPAGAKKRMVDDLRYGAQSANVDVEKSPPASGKPGEIGFLKLRYKLPKEETSRLISQPIMASEAYRALSDAPVDVRFATAVAGFGQMLKGEAWVGSWSYDDAIALARGAKGADPFGLRAEFVNLVHLAKTAKP